MRAIGQRANLLNQVPDSMPPSVTPRADAPGTSAGSLYIVEVQPKTNPDGKRIFPKKER